MEYFLKVLARYGTLSPAHYWHLRLLCAIALGPLAGIGYLLLFGRRGRPRAGTGPTLWINSAGQLATSASPAPPKR
jgi:hypothetical protein